MSQRNAPLGGLGRTGSRVFTIVMGVVIIVIAVVMAFTVQRMANDPQTLERVERIKAEQDSLARIRAATPADSTQ